MKSLYALDSVKLDEKGDSLIIIDQTLLPGKKKYLRLSGGEDVWEAICQLRVRGAPAIGIAAAYGAYLGVRTSGAGDGNALYREFLEV